MTLRRNIALNYGGAAVSALAPVLVLPWYVQALGPGQWGLVSFVTTLTAMLGMLDSGIGQGLVREITGRLHDPAAGRLAAARLATGYARLYLAFAIVAALSLALLAPAIATGWLRLGELPAHLGAWTVYGAAALFLAQFPGFLYRTVLVSAEAYGWLNLAQVAAVVVRHGVGVLVVWQWPRLEVYLAWQAGAAALDTLVRRVLAWRALGVAPGAAGWSREELAATLPHVMGMSFAVLLSVLVNQVDKLILSRLVPVEQLGYYAIASTVALGVLQVVYPVTQAVLPRAVRLLEQPSELRRLNRKLFRLMAALALGGALAYALAGTQVLRLWLRSDLLAAQVGPTLTLLLAGTAANVLYNVGYVNWVARGLSRHIVVVNLAGIGLALAGIPWLVARYGIRGAAVGWIGVNVAGLVASLVWLRRNGAA